MHRTFEAVPLARSPFPAKRQQGVDFLPPARTGVANRSPIGNNRQKKERDAARQVREDGEKIPGQRRAEIRPDMALVGIRDQEICQPWTADVADWNDCADQKREYGDGLGASRNRPPPRRVGEAQDGGDKRACVADTYPEDEISNVKAPV